MRNHRIPEKLAIINMVNSPYITKQWIEYYPPRFCDYYPDILKSMFNNHIDPQIVWDRLFTWRN